MVKNVGVSCHGCPAFGRSFLSSLNQSQIEDLKTNSFKIKFRRGQKIASQNDRAQGIYCICSGVAKYHLVRHESKSVTLAVRTSGDVLGHHELFGGKVTFSVTCLTDVEFCFFPTKVILSRLSKGASLSQRLVKEINADMSELANYLLAVCLQSVGQRVAYFLLYLRDKTGVSENGDINLSLSRQEFSEIVCSNRETVYRELAFLKRKKIIRLKGQSIKIENEAKLRGLVK